MSNENPLGVEEPVSAVEPFEPPSLSTREVLLRLVRLQKEDAVADQLRQRIADIPVTIEAIGAKVEEEKKNLVAAKDREKALLLEHKNFDLDTSKKDEEIRKHGGDLQQVKSNEAYRVLLGEIENLRRAKDDLETKILETLERLDQEKKSQVLLVKSFEITKKEMEAEKSRLEAQKVEAEQALALAVEGRQELIRGIPAGVLARYELLKSKKAGIAVVPLAAGSSCGGCRLSATQQILNNLKKGKDFVICERCQRILYLPE